ncbi:hypothetical protein [Evansella halocellulosilytica]|uniref:hypothetical protein n=1 Tax=Evansella halocellulosilytica TaxID=2011013 RepID=UPI000BB6A241|nr:hypothetical protein [Evansella halocellulosilytica]
MKTMHYTVQLERTNVIDTNVTCSVSNGYMITIPKFIRKKLGIGAGELINIGLSENHEAFILRKVKHDTPDNKIVVNERNMITIPAELRYYLNVKKADQFHIYYTNDRTAVFVKKSDSIIDENCLKDVYGHHRIQKA